MPLDPQVKALMDQLASAGRPRIDTLAIEVARRVAFAAFQPPTVEPVANVADRKIPVRAGSIAIRTYTPDAEGPFPVLVYFHGGGFVMGDLESHDALCRSLTNGARCATVAVDYRLAPENKFPAAADDCYDATLWVAKNTRELNVDANRMAVGGDSAGGNLAAVVAMMARDASVPKVALQVLIYPSMDAMCSTDSYRTIKDPFPSIEECKYFWASYIRSEADRKDPRVSPNFATDFRGLAPALIITAEFDPLCDEGEIYGQKLRAAGVPVKVSRYPGMIHGFVSMGHLIDRGKNGVAEVAAALRKAFSE